jgi:hypothetical protein
LCATNVAGCEGTVGASHKETLLAKARLANAYDWVDRHSEAISLAEITVDGFERTLGPFAVETLESRGNLAVFHLSAGHPHIAIPMFQHILADCERVLGLDHQDTIPCARTSPSA